MAKTKNKYYAYFILDTNQKNIVGNWKDCEKKIKGVNARYKGFKTKLEAQEWLNLGAKYDLTKKKIKSNSKLKSTNMVLESDAIYFDAGTGRGDGVEVRITDKDKNSLINKLNFKNKSQINIYDNLLLGKDVTNNYGELVGCYLALKLALKINCKKIYSDSKLVIDYWSKGIYKPSLPLKTIEKIQKVTILRKEYEKNAGKIKFISGDINPADLGFHK